MINNRFNVVYHLLYSVFLCGRCSKNHFRIFIYKDKIKSKEMRKYIDTFKKFNLNENSNLSFSYRGTELPTQEMIDWFDYEFNQEPENMDNLESDMWSSNQEKEFFEEFKDDLIDLSYFQMLDVFRIARDKKY